MENPGNSLEWMLFLTEKYLKMFLQGTWLTLYIAVIGTILGFILGYIIGIIQDMKISSGDFFPKRILVS
ncbi:MAG: amino acid ABC transporter permease, partial [Lachnospiraceae bacterium]|nr:amino acid ABC transporter permease [Lachnospiraceae bacterium]